MEKKSNYKDVNGVKMPLAFSEEAFRSALNYKAKPGDVIIDTYPKCGTTWMHHIVLLIVRKGKLSEDPLDFFLGCPFLEMMGSESVEMSKSGVMKTHIPYFAVPYSDDAKYIYVARNPKDCVVSFYYHMKMMPIDQEEFGFDKFFETFLEGELGYGDYFDHLLEWYEHRNDKNVYFVTYEELKKDIRTQIRKIAKFIGEEYDKCIEENPEILENIVKYSSFEYMKKSVNDVMDMFLKGDEFFRNRDLPSGLIEIMKKTSSNKKGGGSGAFVRKGIVGDWKNHLNEDQLRRLEMKIAEKTKDSDVMSLWKDV